MSRARGAAALMLLLAACAAKPDVRAHQPPTVITREMLAPFDAENVYDAVQRLRPEWLRRAAARSFTDGGAVTPSLFVDALPAGSVDALRSIAVIDVHQLEFLNPSRATTVFGTGHTAGAIAVTLRRTVER